jgi:hypothetical protein
MSDENLLTSEGTSTTVIDLGFGPKETKETGSCCCFCLKKKSAPRKSHCEVKRSGWSNMQPTPADVGSEDSSIAPSDSFFEIGHEQHRPSIVRKLRLSRDLTMESFPEWQ